MPRSVSVPYSRVKRVAKLADFLVQSMHMFKRQSGSRKQGVAKAAGPGADGTPLVCQSNNHLPFIVRISRTPNKSRRLESFQQRCQRARFQHQFLGYAANRLPIRPPQNIEHKVLRIGQASSSSNGL